MLLKPRPIVCVRSFVSTDLEPTVTAARRLRAGLVTNSVTITLARRLKLRSRVQSARNPSRQERAKTDAEPAKPQASGQIICNQQGCRPVQKGCRVVIGAGTTYAGARGQREQCN